MAQMMQAQLLIGRVREYNRRHGLRATLARLWLSIRRCLTGNRLVLFYLDFADYEAPTAELCESRVVERKQKQAEIEPGDFQQIVDSWNPKTAERQLAERFLSGASLWLCKRGKQLAGFGWTMSGRTIEPHFFPFAGRDVHLFDFFVLPEHRGHRVNPFLVNHILSVFAKERSSRAFIEAAEWNAAQLGSLSRTPFRRLGLARKFRVFGKTVVIWSDAQVSLKEKAKKGKA